MQTITEIEQFIIKSGTDHIKTFGGETEGGANTQQVSSEMAACIHKMLGEKIENYLEIGAAAGGSAFLIHHFFSPSKMVLVDDNKHPKTKDRKNILSTIGHFEIIGNSQDARVVEAVKNIHLEYDLLMIDADHSYEGSTLDVENYVPFVKPGGLIMMHDIAYEPHFGVKYVYGSMKKDTERYELVGEFIAKTGPKCGMGLLRKKSVKVD